MKKIITFILFCLLVLLLFIRLNDNEEEIRVRIIPNSNCEEDISVKENVKGVVCAYIKEIYDSSYSKMCSNIEDTYQILENVISEEIVNARVSFGYHTLYNKTYNNSAVENKNTMTLLIIIDEGKGDNWWGSIYPELLGISSDECYQYESLFVNLFKWLKRS